MMKRISFLIFLLHLSSAYSQETFASSKDVFKYQLNDAPFSYLIKTESTSFSSDEQSIILLRLSDILDFDGVQRSTTTETYAPVANSWLKHLELIPEGAQEYCEQLFHYYAIKKVIVSVEFQYFEKEQMHEMLQALREQQEIVCILEQSLGLHGCVTKYAQIALPLFRYTIGSKLSKWWKEASIVKKGIVIAIPSLVIVGGIVGARASRSKKKKSIGRKSSLQTSTEITQKKNEKKGNGFDNTHAEIRYLSDEDGKYFETFQSDNRANIKALLQSIVRAEAHKQVLPRKFLKDKRILRIILTMFSNELNALFKRDVSKMDKTTLQRRKADLTYLFIIAEVFAYHLNVHVDRKNEKTSHKISDRNVQNEACSFFETFVRCLEKEAYELDNNEEKRNSLYYWTETLQKTIQQKDDICPTMLLTKKDRESFEAFQEATSTQIPILLQSIVRAETDKRVLPKQLLQDNNILRIILTMYSNKLNKLLIKHNENKMDKRMLQRHKADLEFLFIIAEVFAYHLNVHISQKDKKKLHKINNENVQKKACYFFETFMSCIEKKAYELNDNDEKKALLFTWKENLDRKMKGIEDQSKIATKPVSKKADGTSIPVIRVEGKMKRSSSKSHIAKRVKRGAGRASGLVIGTRGRRKSGDENAGSYGFTAQTGSESVGTKSVEQRGRSKSKPDSRRGRRNRRSVTPVQSGIIRKKLADWVKSGGSLGRSNNGKKRPEIPAEWQVTSS